jgi:hypothetical protein
MLQISGTYPRPLTGCHIGSCSARQLSGEELLSGYRLLVRKNGIKSALQIANPLTKGNVRKLGRGKKLKNSRSSLTIFSMYCECCLGIRPSGEYDGACQSPTPTSSIRIGFGRTLRPERRGLSVSNVPLSRNTVAARRIADTLDFDNSPSDANDCPPHVANVYIRKLVTPESASRSRTGQEWHRKCLEKRNGFGFILRTAAVLGLLEILIQVRSRTGAVLR